MSEHLVRSVLHIRPKPGAHEQVVAAFRRLRVLEEAAKQDGFLSGELHLPVAGDGDILVTALWRDEAAYRGWLDNPSRERASEALADLVESEIPPGQLYEVVQAQGTEAN